MRHLTRDDEAELAAAAAAVRAALKRFDPNQPRDPQGRWTATAAGTAARIARNLSVPAGATGATRRRRGGGVRRRRTGGRPNSPQTVAHRLKLDLVAGRSRLEAHEIDPYVENGYRSLGIWDAPADPAQGELTPAAREVLGPGGFQDTQGKHIAGFEDGHPVYTEERVRNHHDRIVAAYLNGKRPNPKGKQALFVAGGTASGKSTVKDDYKAQLVDPVDIDPDAIKEQLPEYKVLNREGDPHAARVVHEESSDLSKRILREANARNLDVVVDGTGDSRIGKFREKIEDQLARGYNVRVVLVDVPTNVAINRAWVRGQDSRRYVPPATIREIHHGVAANYLDWMRMPEIEYDLYSTNVDRGQAPILFATKRKGATGPTVVSPSHMSEFVAKAVGPDTEPDSLEISP